MTQILRAPEAWKRDPGLCLLGDGYAMLMASNEPLATGISI